MPPLIVLVELLFFLAQLMFEFSDRTPQHRVRLLAFSLIGFSDTRVELQFPQLNGMQTFRPHLGAIWRD